MRDDAVALSLRDVVERRRGEPGVGQRTPAAPALLVLQQEPFGRWICHRIVRPASQLVEATVEGPAVATTGFRNQTAEAWVGQHIDPGPQRSQRCTHIELEFCAAQREIADGDARGTGLKRRGWGDGRGGNGLALAMGLLMQRNPLLNVLRQGPLIGLEADPRQRAHSAQFVVREFIGAQQVQSGDGRTGLRRVIGCMAIAQQDDFTLQRVQVGHGLGIDHQQVASDAGPGPQAQCLRQRAQKAQRLHRVGRHHDQRAIARNAEAPQQSSVADAVARRTRAIGSRWRTRQAEQQGAAQGLDGRESLRADAQAEQPNTGQCGRHQGGALYVTALAVFVDHRMECGGAVGGDGGEGQHGLGVCRDVQFGGQCADRVEAGIEINGRTRRGLRQLVEGGQRLTRRTVAAEPALAVGLHAQCTQVRIGVGQKMSGQQSGFGVESGYTLEHQRLVCLLPLGAHKQVGEGRVRFVGAIVGERHFKDRHQFDGDGCGAQIAQFDATELDIVFGADPDGALRLQIDPGRLEADAVSVVGAMVASHRIRRRVPRERDGGRCWLVARRLQPAQVEEAAMGVAQRVVTRTRDADLAPAAPAGAVGPQRNAVAPI